MSRKRVAVSSRPNPRAVFSARLKQLREASGLSQWDLVMAVQDRGQYPGVGRAAVSHWEAGRRIPPPHHLLCILDTLRTSDEDSVGLLGLAAEADTAYRAWMAGRRSAAGGSDNPSDLLAAFRAWGTVSPGVARGEDMPDREE